ncbi:hypothetical protein Tc00.1047053508319.10 [Trypanosoma cruzi]|uniref:Uncharacterized protein n=1 Tax=Trypanosoma cruzi (strain CL Brener) TaxID=353153 RepID=Q4D0V2_TRYCC|nr:hypothetical protein Tc00.1047053508319.10 [Trypanosoma cruzi]EAN86148.1 hypothetical protein Tc00.1047053508319.10 [Trypanosoma cruzi]|eukprot:XP_807999.1 hypothetical protein [Trypanosoma cruzi strain CL Brener]
MCVHAYTCNTLYIYIICYKSGMTCFFYEWLLANNSLLLFLFFFSYYHYHYYHYYYYDHTFIPFHFFFYFIFIFAVPHFKHYIYWVIQVNFMSQKCLVWRPPIYIYIYTYVVYAYTELFFLHIRMCVYVPVFLFSFFFSFFFFFFFDDSALVCLFIVVSPFVRSFFLF